ncbi:MAG TPA: class I tRNA ligase family protein, partial [Dissulfurispiraceae bacterium]|nr:class I tRNA ligase family protein [Dissulfurispiraceae bacterium]
DLEWSDKGVEGAYRFINKLWNTVFRNIEAIRPTRACSFDGASLQASAATALLRKTHQTIRKVTDDIEKDYHFNTAIAALMELVNEMAAFTPQSETDRSVLGCAMRNAVLMISPFAPHVAEELWEALGEGASVFEQPWPAWDAALAKDEEIELVVQVNGRLRAKIVVPAGLSEEAAREKALADPKVAEHTAGKQIVKILVVQGRLVNIVMK